MGIGHPQAPFMDVSFGPAGVRLLDVRTTGYNF